jgi:mannose-6-phosphate isomerase-like protein (cupin superfamily)
MVIVPPDAWHTFTNTGDTLLRQTAIHQNPRAVTDFEDGTAVNEPMTNRRRSSHA